MQVRSFCKGKLTGKMENFNTMLNKEEGYAERSYCRRKVYPFSGHWAKVMDFLLFHSVFGYSRKPFSKTIICTFH